MSNNNSIVKWWHCFSLVSKIHILNSSKEVTCFGLTKLTSLLVSLEICDTIYELYDCKSVKSETGELSRGPVDLKPPEPCCEQVI